MLCKVTTESKVLSTFKELTVPQLSRIHRKVHVYTIILKSITLCVHFLVTMVWLCMPLKGTQEILMTTNKLYCMKRQATKRGRYWIIITQTLHWIQIYWFDIPTSLYWFVQHCIHVLNFVVNIPTFCDVNIHATHSNRFHTYSFCVSFLHTILTIFKHYSHRCTLISHNFVSFFIRISSMIYSIFKQISLKKVARFLADFTQILNYVWMVNNSHNIYASFTH